MEPSQHKGIIATIRNIALVVGGMVIVFLGITKFSSRSHQASATPLDGIAHADAPVVGDAGAACGDSGACGCGDGDGGC